MCGKRASIHVACLKVESYLAKCLDGIAEEESTVFMRNARKLRDGLDCAELVVDALDADEAAGIARGLNRGEQVLKRFGVDDAVFARSNAVNLVTIRLKGIGRVQNGVVLDCRDDHMRLARAWYEMRQAFDGHVVGLGPRRGEDDLGRSMRPQGPRDARTGIAQLGRGLASLGIQCVGVCPRSVA